MIRQTVSCDICGTEKQQTNRWFVAQDQGEELCISGWYSQKFLSPGAKHLCGHTCMHKLVDEFMDRKRADQLTSCATNEVEVELYPVVTDTSLTSETAYVSPEEAYVMPEKTYVSTEKTYVSPEAPNVSSAYGSSETFCDEFESSARLVPTPLLAPASTPTPVAVARPPVLKPVELVAKSTPKRGMKAAPPVDDAPRFTSRDWRTEAWEREREREQRAAGRQPESGSRRRFIS